MSIGHSDCMPLRRHRLEALRAAQTLPVLVSLLGISSRKLLHAPLALVYRWVLRMRALVMAVTIVLAGECNAAFVAQEANGWRRRCGGLPQRGGRKRRPVWVLEISRGGRGHGDLLELLRMKVVSVLSLLRQLLVRHVGLGGRGWWVTGY